MAKPKYDVGRLSSKSRKRLGDAIRLSHMCSIPKTKLHKATANELLKDGMIVDFDYRWVIVLPWYDAYRKHFKD